MGQAPSCTSSIKLEARNYKSSVTLLIPHKDWNLLEKRKRRLRKNTAEQALDCEVGAVQKGKNSFQKSTPL